jgi:hypothetical protein
VQLAEVTRCVINVKIQRLETIREEADYPTVTMLQNVAHE